MSAQEFDLTHLHIADKRGVRKIYVSSVFGVGVLCAGLIVWDVSANGSNPGTAVGVFAAGLLGAFNFWLGVRVLLAMRRPSARRLTIDDRGVLVQFDGGRTDQYEWSNPRVRFDLAQVMDSPSPYDPSGVLTSPGGVPVPLSLDELNAIVEAARSRGLSVSVTMKHIRYVGDRPIYAIRGARWIS